MKHVIFDLGNVLINFDLNVFYRQIQTAVINPWNALRKDIFRKNLKRSKSVHLQWNISARCIGLNGT